jgi:hypothetical protein
VEGLGGEAWAEEGWPVVVCESADVVVGSCGDVGQVDSVGAGPPAAIGVVDGGEVGGQAPEKEKRDQHQKATTKTKTKTKKAARQKLTISVSVGAIPMPEMAMARI